jgi:hypothetical protein
MRPSVIASQIGNAAIKLWWANADELINAGWRDVRKSRKRQILSKATLPIHEEFTYVTELQVGLLT